MFEYFYKNGAQVRPGAVLTVWIVLDGGIELLKKLLDEGADINCHLRTGGGFDGSSPLQAAAKKGKEEVVLLLLKAGAAVNAPAIGSEGRTALQAACCFDTATQEEQARKDRILMSLIEHGANINAAPAQCDGSTALQLTAERGDLHTALLLLEKGADVNAPPCGDREFETSKFQNTLDQAASMGCLDMVKLFLNRNALSHTRGDTGYDGAIEIAEEDDHFAVAELIRRHAAESSRDEQLINPYLSHPPRDWHEYENEWDRAQEYAQAHLGGDLSSDSDSEYELSPDSDWGSDTKDEEASNAPGRCETVVPLAKHGCHADQEDIPAEAPDNASAAVGQDVEFLSEEGDFSHVASQSVWTEARNSVTRGNGQMGGHIIWEFGASDSDPVLSDLTWDDILTVWTPEK
ncbi:hypothetical protein SLS53_006339 [Cytospora paraplurivora]|uniref:Ankyrin n=1 Tax=Cytospora paraplurivora TaxID=2898453 RepID=A0AAN9U3F4_9PEZI